MKALTSVQPSDKLKTIKETFEMAGTNFKTENNTFRKLLGNGLTYRIPPFQRDYSWTEEQWDDLWQDILIAVSDETADAHYMGYLVLQSEDDRVFDVIDGQQRLTTLSLIVLAVLKQLGLLVERGVDPGRNKARLEQLRSSYIGYLDPVTLVPRSKLMLNRNNDNYYQHYIVPLSEPLPMRGFKATELQLRRAFQWFDLKAAEYSAGESDPGVALAKLVDRLSDQIFFTVITVNDELNAYTVFETLNARGVRLSVTDLLKNHLFSVLHRERQDDAEIRALEDRWEAIASRLGEESLPDFLRIHWNSRKPSVRQSGLFKVIRAGVRDRQSVFTLLQQMEQDIDIYLALTGPENSGLSQNQREDIAALKLFGVRQPFSMLMTAHRLLGPSDFGAVLRAIVAICFRYNVVGGRNTGDQERVYNAAIGRLVSESIRNGHGVIQALAEIYPLDDEFEGAFSQKSFVASKNKHGKIVRYILAKLESQASASHVDGQNPQNSVEHILPRNPENGWEAFNQTPAEYESLSYRIGNMTLLEATHNRKAGNADFEAKRPIYRGSQFSLTRAVADENEEWTPSAIDRRQSRLASLATAVWRVPQFDR